MHPLTPPQSKVIKMPFFEGGWVSQQSLHLYNLDSMSCLIKASNLSNFLYLCLCHTKPYHSVHIGNQRYNKQVFYLIQFLASSMLKCFESLWVEVKTFGKRSCLIRKSSSFQNIMCQTIAIWTAIKIFFRKGSHFSNDLWNVHT